MINFGLEVQMLKDVVQMIPILHHKDIALIHDQNFDGSQEVVVRLSVTFAAYRRPET